MLKTVILHIAVRLKNESKLRPILMVSRLHSPPISYKLIFMNISGLIVAMITPSKAGKVDIPSFKKLTEHLIKGGADALFVLGTTGEFNYLTFNEKKEILESLAFIKNHKIPVLTGISAKTKEETLELIKLADTCKTDAFVLAPLFEQEDPTKITAAVLEASGLPVMLYNNPGIQNGRSLEFPFIASMQNKVMGIKDSTADMDYFEKLLTLSSGDFPVFQGREKKIIQSLEKGAAGIVSGTSNIYPEKFKHLCKTKNPGEQEKLLAIKKDIALLDSHYTKAIKIQMKKIGLIDSEEMF